ncbi:hypothetical protein AAK894_13745 [Lachnospiraceae bacterium 46-61]
MNIKNKIIQKMLFIVMWCFLISFTACTSDDSTTDTQQEQQKQQEQTQAEQPPQQTETKKGMTEAEQQYFAQVQPDLQQMINEFNKICDIVLSSNDIEDWKAAIPFAENCVVLGDRLENLEATDGLSNLVCILGIDVSSVSESFIGYLENNDIEILKDWREIEMYDIIVRICELSAYVQEGKTIEQQLKEELKSVISDEEIKHMAYMPGGRSISFRLTESSTEESLKKIYDIIKMIGMQEKYDYLSVRFEVDYYAKVDGKIWTFMYVKFNNSRKQIDFDTIQWSDIPKVADVYQNQMD